VSTESNVGFIGAGRHADWSHLEQLVQVGGVRIGALADLDAERLTEIKQRYELTGADTTQRWEDIVEHPDLDAVFVMTPDNQHTEQLLASVEHDKHAFVEKPLADSWRDYTRLASGLVIAERKGLIVSSCHPRRFDPPFVNTKQLLDDRQLLAATFGLDPNIDLGPVTALGINLNYSRPARTGLHTSFLSDHMPHEMDTASHFLGISGLRRAVSTKNEELEFDIDAMREDGVRLRFKGNRLQEETGWHEDLEITFADGSTLAVDAHTGEIVLTRNNRPEHRTPTDEEGKLLFKTDYDERFLRLNTHFIRSLQRQETPYLTRREMLMNTVVSLALQDVYRFVSITADGDVANIS